MMKQILLLTGFLMVLISSMAVAQKTIKPPINQPHPEIPVLIKGTRIVIELAPSQDYDPDLLGRSLPELSFSRLDGKPLKVTNLNGTLGKTENDATCYVMFVEFEVSEVEAKTLERLPIKIEARGHYSKSELGEYGTTTGEIIMDWRSLESSNVIKMLLRPIKQPPLLIPNKLKPQPSTGNH